MNRINKIKYFQISLFIYSFILFPLFIFGCEINRQEERNNKKENDNNLLTKKFYFEGENLYNKLCAQCHTRTGKGFKNLYPPLENSDFLFNNEKRLPCIIYYGMDEEIIVNGTSFSYEMPSNPNLSTRQIAQLIVYIKKRFMNRWEWITLDAVRKEINKCKD